MVLHLGNLVIISSKKLIGIFDYNLIKKDGNGELYNFINYSNKKVINVDEGAKIKSLIITDNEIYLSPIATNTLKKRIEKLY
ncbi:protein of unknown function [Anaerobranca californiensis DSM 14826]|jgi:regulator of extracellular matrix RemA (YlzA/DUF370 family)|uniref:DUF370 domain-containing protein n=1 Tax=Anaerobranca californiensis DSM 14826 TaxID=1120989 RepID=A0A1M6M1D8_9FIRM|nr:extracellular matrix/biofilm biosynthesis regulator RemA family protein [Anaerobranca californiensis]SHJ77268.1 protein of unknown function [Anaerobranca californiensis DSM 14826]